MSERADIVVAGHICLDIIPSFGDARTPLNELLRPGTLVEIGPAVVSTGGAVSNTGLALHRLGLRARLMGKVGDDLFGDAIRAILRRYDAVLADAMIVCPGVQSSYTVVLNPPNADRTFLHCTGANDEFSAADVPYNDLGGARLFHFGYPPSMRRFYSDDGTELETLFQNVHERGLVTSLDMTRPDPASQAGRADWDVILRRALPHVDVFLPSLDEIMFMLDRRRHEELCRTGDPAKSCDGDELGELAHRLLDMGVAIVGFKLGDRGLYVRTSGDADRIGRLRGLWTNTPTQAVEALVAAWRGRELYSPCFAVEVAGTTGCGDCTIAGFLAALLNAHDPASAVTTAVAVGACAAEQADAYSGVPNWSTVQQRIAAGWPRLPATLILPSPRSEPGQ
ncbi:MAG: carbohydrate kinase family protein [Phycisphaerae bacterium]|nr:carbohydrate kinase family protein [Phycisphaerae bacterium]